MRLDRAMLAWTMTFRGIFAHTPHRQPSTAGRPKSFLRDPSLSQTGEIGAFDQSTDLRHPPRCDDPEVGDAGITRPSPTNLRASASSAADRSVLHFRAYAAARNVRNCGCAGVALRALSYQMIATSVRDCSRCTDPILL